MACFKEKMAVTGAGLVGGGSVAAMFTGIALVPGIMATAGSLILLGTLLKDLADCLDRNGEKAKAARVREHAERILREANNQKEKV